MVENTKERPWITFIAVLLLLTGIYGTARTAINFAAFPKYPTGGVFDFSIFNGGGMMGGYPGPREQDCNYPGYFYKSDGITMRDPSDLEKKQADEQKVNCMSGVTDAREAAKVNDISKSLLFFFLGAGTLVSRKVLKF